jgi:hypothetical protein
VWIAHDTCNNTQAPGNSCTPSPTINHSPHPFSTVSAYTLLTMKEAIKQCEHIMADHHTMSYQVFSARYVLWKKTMLSKNCRGREISPRRPGFDPRSVYLRLVVDKFALENVYLRILLVSPVSIILTVLHTHLHINIALTRRTNWRSLRPLETATLFRKVENTGQKSTFTAKGKLRSHTNWCVLSRYCVAYSLSDKKHRHTPHGLDPFQSYVK